MMTHVHTAIDPRIAKYVDRVKTQKQTTDADIVQELIENGYDDMVRQLHLRYQQGELTFRTIASELGLSVRELYDLFEQKNLPT